MAEYQRLGEALLRAGLIRRAELERALKRQRVSGRRLGDLLVSEGLITERQLAVALSNQLGIEFVDLSDDPIPCEMADELSGELAKQLRVVPVRVEHGSLILAMADPTDLDALSEARASSGRRITPAVALPEAVDRAISELYGNIGAKEAIAEMSAESHSAGAQTKPQTGENSPAVRLVNSIIERGVCERASDIHIEPREGYTAVRIRVDGVLRRIMTVPRELTGAVVSRIKVMADLDLSEKRQPQDGRAGYTAGGAEIDLRISTLPTVYGEKVSIRILNKNAQLKNAEALGLCGDELERYRLLMRQPDGMLLITGPTGSGKSSTMYTMISVLNSEAVNLVTLEDPVEYDIDGVNQVQINERAGLTFASGLRSVLRQDPDIIAVGEIRDSETAQIALRAAITGHLVLSTVHTSGAAALIDRLIDLGCEPYLIAEAVRGVISQRLVRRICPDCREEYVADGDELRRLGLPEDSETKLYRGAGCSACYHTGYSGRIAVFEILLISKEIKRMIAENRPREELISRTVSEGRFRTLRENALRLVLDGVTTEAEFTRILTAAEF